MLKDIDKLLNSLASMRSALHDLRDVTRRRKECNSLNKSINELFDESAKTMNYLNNLRAV
jgi:hypothetical protein